MLTLTTQAANASAIALYEQYGFKKYSSQSVYHCWLPDDLDEASAVGALVQSDVTMAV